MSIDEKKKTNFCPRCGMKFACKVGFPFHCDCQNLSLTQEELTYIRNINSNQCFCTDCLQALKAEFQRQKAEGSTLSALSAANVRPE